MPDENSQEESVGQNEIVAENSEQQDLEKLLDSVPPEMLVEALDRRGASSRMRASITSWQAPLPPADMLRQYDDISPGFADRIIKSSEREQDHRHGCEKSALGASISAEKRGQWMAFWIALAMIGISAYLISMGQVLAGSIFGGVTLLGLVALFQNKQWKFWRKEETKGEDE